MTIARRQLALSAFSIALLSACATPPGSGGLEAAAERSGLSAERLARIPVAMKAEVDKGTFPGAVTLVARHGWIVHFEAVGYLDAAKTKPMTKDALFRLASMTKPIVTVAGMMLVEQGAMKLNDPIATWLPELKDLKVETSGGDVALARPITVQDLMRHSAGFVYGGASRSERVKKLYAELDIEALETDITANEMLKRLGTIPLVNQPGAMWEYSIATDVLGLLLERVTTKSLDVVLRQMLFDPLGMDDTGWWVPAEARGRLAEASDRDPMKGSLLKSYRQFDNPVGKSYLRGGAGLVGTAEDYLKFAQMILDGGEYGGRRYLSKKTVEFMLSDHIVGMAGTTVATTGPGYGFGLGFGVRLHDGVAWVPGSKGDAMWAGIWGTSFWIDPKEQLVGILMTQSPSNRIHSRMLYKNLVYGAMVK